MAKMKEGEDPITLRRVPLETIFAYPERWLSSQVRGILLAAHSASERDGHNHVDTVHVLMGLLTPPDGYTQLPNNRPQDVRQLDRKRVEILYYDDEPLVLPANDGTCREEYSPRIFSLLGRQITFSLAAELIIEVASVRAASMGGRQISRHDLGMTMATILPANIGSGISIFHQFIDPAYADQPFIYY